MLFPNSQSKEVESCVLPLLYIPTTYSIKDNARLCFLCDFQWVELTEFRVFDQQQKSVCIFDGVVQIGGHINPCQLCIGFERLPGFYLSAFVLKKMRNFVCRAFTQVIHVRFVCQTEYCDFFSIK